MRLFLEKGKTGIVRGVGRRCFVVENGIEEEGRDAGGLDRPSPAGHLEELGRRVTELECRLRRMTALVAGTALVLFTVAAGSIIKPIESRRISVVDRFGKQRLLMRSLGRGNAEAVEVRVTDDRGVPRLEFTTGSNEKSPVLLIRDGRKSPMAEFSLARGFVSRRLAVDPKALSRRERSEWEYRSQHTRSGFADDRYEFTDPVGYPLAALEFRLWKDGPALCLVDGRGRVRAALQIVDAGSRLVLADDKGSPQAAVTVEKDRTAWTLSRWNALEGWRRQ
ncbi:MAG: hypothetical protein D6679_07145 [Candidatus Hydrogenedentota bacterium]|nr:MAG: hypothetical protein D6679_07145 [Candidatus Hydrogenedentota bacterium]